VTFQQLLLGNTQSEKTGAIMSMGANKASNSASGISFKNILDGRIYNKTSASVSPDKTDQAGEAKYKSFIEAQRAQKTSKAKETDSNKNKKAAVSETDKGEITPGYENTVGLVAQILGVNAGELQKLLDEAGIVLEPAGSIEGIRENALRLSQLLGLNEVQQEAMLQLFEIARETIEDLGAQEGQSVLPQMGNEALPTADLSESADMQQISNEAGFELPATGELVQKLKMQVESKLVEFTEEMANDSETAKLSVQEAIKPFISNSSNVKIREPQESLENESIDVFGQNLSVKQGTEQKPLEDSGKESRFEDRNQNEQEAPDAAFGISNPNIQASFAILEPDKTIEALPEQIAPYKAVPVSPEEIISQIVEKASVFVKPEKSEMTIELKPESLGKLSLKIAAENGVITAKFVAESYQVKQVLESNMELLKDALEKQGMNLEGFSVSVGQDSKQPERQFKQMHGAGGSKSKGTSYAPAGIGFARETLYGIETVKNPYRWEDSTINLTA